MKKFIRNIIFFYNSIMKRVEYFFHNIQIGKDGEGFFRTKNNQIVYLEGKKSPLTECPLCTEKSIKDFNNWRMITNKFPYDEVASVHHMLVLKEHKDTYSFEDFQELEKIRLEMNGEYNTTFENLPAQMTFPSHRHIHLLKLKTKK